VAALGRIGSVRGGYLNGRLWAQDHTAGSELLLLALNSPLPFCSPESVLAHSKRPTGGAEQGAALRMALESSSDFPTIRSVAS